MDDRLRSSDRSVMKMAKDGYLVDERISVHHGDKKRSSDVGVNERLYKRYSSRRGNWDRIAAECERFRAGYQWSRSQIEELKRKKKAPIVVNLQNPAVEQLKSLLTSNAPRFNALPREGSDRKTATAFSGIMEYLWQRNRCNPKLKDAIDDYSVKGLGYMTAYWDPYEDFGKGEIIIEDLDPYNVYVDPLSKKRDFSDARHILVVHDWSQEQCQSIFSGLKDSFFKDLEIISPRNHDTSLNPTDIEIDALQDTKIDYYRVIDRYSKRRQTMCHYQAGEYEFVIEKEYADEYKKNTAFIKTVNDLQDGTSEEQYIIEQDDISELMMEMRQLGVQYHIIEQMNMETGEPELVPVPGPPTPEAIAMVTIERVTVKKLVERGSLIETEYTGNYVYRVLTIGNKVYWKGYTGLQTYPVVPFPNRHKRNPYPFSDVHATIDLQKELNVTRMHIMTHTANTASIKVAVPRGSGKVSDLEDKLGQAGVSVIEYNHEDGGAPHFMHPPQMPNALYESEKRFEMTIYEQFGVYPFMGGGQGGHSTSSGILIMDELAQRRIASKRTDIEESLNVLGRVVMELIQIHYTEQKVIRILQPSGRYNEIDLNSPVYDKFSGRLLHRINDVTLGTYDLIIASGSTLPSNRMIRMEYFMKLYAQNLIDQYEVLKNVDEVDAEGVMERMGLLNSLQAQVEQLMEEVKALQGDLQTADREAVGARKRVEVEKFKAQLAQMKASIDKQLNAGKERALAQMKEQAKSAGGQMTTASDEALITELNSIM